MMRWIKKIFYFPLAYYFRYFAQIQLSLWKPRIIVVTGSSGKTTLLHLLESQIGKEAKYSYQANSAYGISFDILGLKRTKLTKDEWLSLFLLAPFKAFKAPPEEKLYIVEADCDRPKEGKFLGSLLRPEVVLWLNVSKSHSTNFDGLVKQGKFQTIDEAIAYEFGYFIEYCSGLAVVNGDSDLIRKQISRTKAKVALVFKKDYLQKFQEFKEKILSFNFLLPEETLYALAMSDWVVNYLNRKVDRSYINFRLPPGRGSIFKGIKKTTIVDSSYNANLDSMRAVLDVFAEMPAKSRWFIAGDMVEQGDEEQKEHEKLAEIMLTKKLDKIILVGPRLMKAFGDKAGVEKFSNPKEALNYLLNNLKGGETLLFKGAGFLEGIIEHLLADKKDIENLCRREKVWAIRRRQRGL